MKGHWKYEHRKMPQIYDTGTGRASKQEYVKMTNLANNIGLTFSVLVLAADNGGKLGQPLL